MRLKVRNTFFLILGSFSSLVLAEGRGGRYPGRRPIENERFQVVMCSPIFERVAAGNTELREAKNVLIERVGKPVNLLKGGVPVSGAIVVKVLRPEGTGMKNGEEIVIIPDEGASLSNLENATPGYFDLDPIPPRRIKHHGSLTDSGGLLERDVYSFAEEIYTTVYPIFLATPSAKSGNKRRVPGP